jgi:hypothetical protein
LSKLLTILAFVLLSCFTALGQVRTGSLPEANEKIVKSYPNPAISVINLEIQGSFEKGLEIQIYNFLGKKVFENKNISQKTTINLAEFNRGVYIYRLRDQVGNILESGKFQVSK